MVWNGVLMVVVVVLLVGGGASGVGVAELQAPGR